MVIFERKSTTLNIEKPSSPPFLPNLHDENSCSWKAYVKAHVDKQTSDSITPVSAQPGKLYGTCNVDKDGYPLRPVIPIIKTWHWSIF